MCAHMVNTTQPYIIVFIKPIWNAKYTKPAYPATWGEAIRLICQHAFDVKIAFCSLQSEQINQYKN